MIYHVVLQWQWPPTALHHHHPRHQQPILPTQTAQIHRRHH